MRKSVNRYDMAELAREAQLDHAGEKFIGSDRNAACSLRCRRGNVEGRYGQLQYVRNLKRRDEQLPVWLC